MDNSGPPLPANGRPAEVPRDLGDGAVRADELQDAAEAVKQEHRESSKTVRLRCLSVKPVGDAEAGLFALDVSRFAELDWTWEGARAFRRAPNGDVAGAAYSWSGEVLEVDEVAGRIFVSTGSGDVRPSVGDFLVAPFEFLAALHRLYSGDLAGTAAGPLALGLAGAVGSVKPRELSKRDEPHAAMGVWARSWSRLWGAGGAGRTPASAASDVWAGSWSRLWGPPGTGKTTTIGEQVAGVLANPDERVLVVSTTNRATDEVALSIGRAVRAAGLQPTRDTVCRVGSGADIARYEAQNLVDLLVGGESWLRSEMSRLHRERERERSPEHRAALSSQIQQLRTTLSAGRLSILDVPSRVVVATVFAAAKDMATPQALACLARGAATFTTVIIDEAGVVSRAAVAALSLLAGRRVVLVGDPKQLSPVSRMSRVLPTSQAKWIAASALAHVRSDNPGTHMLVEQHRMHPEIRRAVSEYQYDGKLADGATVRSREVPLDSTLAALPRAIWYVLDEDTDEVAHIRAERGPGNKSWVRQRSPVIVERLFRAHPSLREASGLFITPFVAQARRLAEYLGFIDAPLWSASTTHRQQGAEADVVVLDTVNASSSAWPHDEWQRLINVGMSRARHLLIVLASRSEMREPYMTRLAGLLAPRVLRGTGGQLKWTEVGAIEPQHPLTAHARKQAPEALGAQLEARKAMRPILSADQQRLCAFSIDGKPRLVRGIAGSGKTLVLANWLARRVAEDGSAGKFWVVYANAALRGLLEDMIEGAWKTIGRADPFPWPRVELMHLLGLLDSLERQAGVPAAPDSAFDPEGRSRLLLGRTFAPMCKALFIDEAQDFGDVTLELLVRLVEPSDPTNPQARSVNIFYDNAQNVYGRGTPRWSQLGLDMRGRSTVMKESFRSTQPIAEFALNALYRLQPPDDDPDHAELVERGLVDHEKRNGRRWWRVRFNHVHGPPPEFRRYVDRETELQALSDRLVQWVGKEGVRPGDIRIIANDPHLRGRIVSHLAPALQPMRARVEEQRSRRFDDADDLVIVTTPHSFKGHEGEVVAVFGADKFVAKDHATDSAGRKKTLPSVLYVALTRARSVLWVSSIERSAGSPAAVVVDALQTSIEDLRSPPPEGPACTPVEEHMDLVERVGADHRDWLKAIAAKWTIQSGPICRADGSIAAEPLFWFRHATRGYACLAEQPTAFVAQELEDVGFRALLPGGAVGQ